jgi:uncharacterized membrane protein YeaQ/YmgE (transglycosylase-associated protein family)
MIISAHGILVIVLIGVVAGWLAGRVVRGAGFGLLGDLVIGMIGALIASWLFPRLGVQIGNGLGQDIVYAMLGAIILLLVVRLFRMPHPW